MKKALLLLLFTVLSFGQAPTKNVAGFYAGATTMNAAAIGQFDSTTKGFLIPRMTTTQRNAISSPPASLLIFNTTTGKYNYYDGTTWVEIAAGTTVPTLQQVTNAGFSTTNPLYSSAEIISSDPLTNRGSALSNDGVTVSKDSSTGGTIKADDLTAVEEFQLPDRGGFGGTFAMIEDVPTTATDVNALAIDGSNATGMVNIGSNNFMAAGIYGGSEVATTGGDSGKYSKLLANGGIEIVTNPDDATANYRSDNLDSGNNPRIQAPNLPNGDYTPIFSINTQQGTLSGGITLTTNNIPDSTDKRYQKDNQSLFNDATSSIQTQLNGKQASLGFTPENIVNKATNFTTLNNTLYPTTQAVANYIGSFGYGTGTVTAVNGTTNRVTSTGGTTPTLDISITFENLLSKKANTIDVNNASSTSAQLAGVLSNETGTALAVFNNGPTLIDPIYTGAGSPTYTQGKLTYDTDNESLTFFNNDSNVSLQVGQEQWIRVKNVTGSTIANGAAVYINGSSSGMPTIALAQANSGTTTVCAGLATESIANNAIGYVTALGLVNGIDTSAFSTGSIYLSSSVAGGLTQTAPTAPNFRYRIGFVTNVNASTGKIHVTPTTASIGNGTADQVFGINSAGTAQELKTLQGTTGRLTVTGGSGTETFDISPSYIGQNTITTLGTVSTGTWQATAIGAQYGGTGQNASASTGVAQVNSGTWSFSTALANGTTATTQAASDNSTKVATTAYADLKVSNTLNTSTTVAPSSSAVSNFVNLKNYAAKTANYTLSMNQITGDYFVDATANTFTLTLPSASSTQSIGRVFVLKNSGTGVITIATSSSQTIDGVTTKTLNTQYSGYMVMSDGANWKIISAF